MVNFIAKISSVILKHNWQFKHDNINKQIIFYNKCYKIYINELIFCFHNVFCKLMLNIVKNTKTILLFELFLLNE